MIFYNHTNYMKDNYYTLKGSNRGKKRKRKTRNYKQHYNSNNNRKLNYKKVIITFILITLIFYLLILGILKIGEVIKNKSTPTLATNNSSTTITLTAIGDIMCHSSNITDAYNDKTKTYDFSHVFAEIKPYIQNADISIGNLETTFSGKAAGYTGYPNFNSPEILAKNLYDIGLDIVSTANNHSLDKNYAGLENTLNELDKIGINHTGTARSKEEQNTILIKNINNINIAFLSYTYGTNGIPIPKGKEFCINLINKDFILEQLNLAKNSNADVICVSMHWGEEYKNIPNNTQKELADFLFKNGADIIIGNHPHVLQPMEKRTITLEDGSNKDGFIVYSLGNFVSGQTDEATKLSIILNLQITKHSNNSINIDYNYVPIYTMDNGIKVEHRYTILDINTYLNKFENNDSNISEWLYNLLKNCKNNIEKTVNNKN